MLRIRKALSSVYNRLRPMTEHERMSEYLSQAQDHAHLEYLIDNWERNKGFKK